MKRILTLFVVSIWMLLNTSLSSAQTVTETIFDRYADNDFAYGADISWGGSNFRNKDGVSKDLLTILKEQGVNSVRYRVWYPANGPSGKNEVVRNAKAAHDKGFKVMIDFHYSDSWADPGKQYIPSAWAGHTTDQLVQDVYDHTKDVLTALKNVGVTPAWVQIGNETKRGMLWPNGNTKDTPGGKDNFARMVNSGYDAIKSVDSTIQAIVHLPDADENSLYRSMFDALRSRGAKWDIIGMSAYPHWAHLDWQAEIDATIATMKDVIERYDTKVMVVETGHQWYKPYESNNFLVELMAAMKKIGGLGCFWWEPQATMVGIYELTAWNPDTRQPTIAMDAYLGIKHLDPATVIHVSLEEPIGGTIYQQNENITILANASHDQGEIAKVSFYVNDKLVGEKTDAPYSYDITNAEVGKYNIYAVAKDTKDISVKSETVTVQVGSVEIIQENNNGYCGITNNAGTIDDNNENFTGDGFVNTDNVLGATVNWTVNFVEAGTYKLEFRHAATSTRPGEAIVNGESVGTIPFASSGSWTVWTYSSINITITEAGEVPISVIATGDSGLPNVDYLSIQPVGSTAKPTGALNCLEQPEEPNSITSSEELNSFSVYQNSEQNQVIVKSSKKLNEIRIYTMSGAIVKTLKDVNNTNVEIPCSEMLPGIYLLQAISDNDAFVKQFNIVK